MTESERKTKLRHLVGTPYADPDPTSWLVAADLIEEYCTGGECCLPWPCALDAGRWRARGRWLEAILGGYGFFALGLKDTGRHPHAGRTSVPVCARSRCGPVSVLFEPRMVTTEVLIDVPEFGPPLSFAIWRHPKSVWTPADLEAYLVRRAFQLIDKLFSPADQNGLGLPLDTTGPG